MSALVDWLGGDRPRHWLPVGTLIVLVILVGTLQPRFLQPATLLQLASDTAVLFILAMGRPSSSCWAASTCRSSQWRRLPVSSSH